MKEPDIREYKRWESAIFAKTREKWGGFSNMCKGYPLLVNGLYIANTEILYQACRFPYTPIQTFPYPTIQDFILRQTNPMDAKRISRQFIKHTRKDWESESVRVIVMRWVLKVKLACNWVKFSRLLLESKNLEIVEYSRKDDFWGAKPRDKGVLKGRNVLGRLLMELRSYLVEPEIPDFLKVVSPPDIEDFLLFDQPIEPVHAVNYTCIPF